MRTFYIFKINSIFQTFYNDKSNVLFKMFKDIYHSKNNDFINNFRLFEKVTLPFDKKMLSDYILLKHSEDLYYRKKDNFHSIENVDETSNIIINTTYLKIKSNVNMNSFIKDIINTNENLFVIDFKNEDYFWLNKDTNKILV